MLSLAFSACLPACQAVRLVVEEVGIDIQGGRARGTVLLARDTRPSGERLLQAALQVGIYSCTRVFNECYPIVFIHEVCITRGDPASWNLCVMVGRLARVPVRGE